MLGLAKPIYLLNLHKRVSQGSAVSPTVNKDAAGHTDAGRATGLVSLILSFVTQSLRLQGASLSHPDTTVLGAC